MIEEGTDMDNNTIFCPNCGMQNENGDAFCGNCGSKLAVQIEQPDPYAASAEVAPMVTVEQNDNAINYSQNTPQAYSNVNAMSNPEAGRSHATASLVLGIISVVFWFFGYGAILSLILGFIGLMLAGKAKEEGDTSGTRTAGFVLSLIGLIGGAIVLIACVACVGSVGLLGAAGL